MRISDWSSDVCSSDLGAVLGAGLAAGDGGVDEGDAPLLAGGGQLARQLGRGGGVVDENAARGHAGEGPLLAQHHAAQVVVVADAGRSEEPTSELQSLMRTSYAVLCLQKKTETPTQNTEYK